MLTVTANAIEQIKEILLEEESSKYVRAFIEGGGCSGFNYGFMIEDVKNEDDFEVTEKLLVDSASMQYFSGATIDYKKDRLTGSQFVITNPNAKSTCGCGSSFSV
ncbi:MAG: iron-sulfur cluster assembly accessory protein [Bacteroidota bacterium]|jgi:iron-sulfur cluster insertion protein